MRPSEREIEKALELLDWVVRRRGEDLPVDLAASVAVLREASERLLPTNEAAAILGIEPGNMRPDSVKGLPEPEVTWPRPTVRNPDQVVRWWSERKIRKCAAGRRPRRKREDGAA